MVNALHEKTEGDVFCVNALGGRCADTICRAYGFKVLRAMRSEVGSLRTKWLPLIDEVTFGD